MTTGQVSWIELTHDPAAVFKRVMSAREPVLVMRGSQPAVAVISMDDYEFLEQARRQQSIETRQAQRAWAARAQQLREAIAQRVGAPLPDSVAELHELREERANGGPDLH
ncbi:MAG: hypothetical protein WHX52_07785 [Anaerolineae bacterium]